MTLDSQGFGLLMCQLNLGKLDTGSLAVYVTTNLAHWLPVRNVPHSCSYFNRFKLLRVYLLSVQ